jgi:hypothetical protein
MIDFVGWPRASLNSPNDAVGQMIAVINADATMNALVGTACGFIRKPCVPRAPGSEIVEMLTRASFEAQSTRFGVIC